MTKSTKRISLIHATSVAIGPVVRAFARLWPEAETHNLLEDSLSADLERDGELTANMTERFFCLARYAVDCGADGILYTCSAYGPAIEAAAQAMAPMPFSSPPSTTSPCSSDGSKRFCVP